MKMVNEAAIRLSVFLGLFALFAALEYIAPKHRRKVPQLLRWRTNLAITVLNTVALRMMAFAVPLLAIGAAIDANSMGWGALNQIALPIWLETLIAIAVLDFAIWAQHMISHRVPLFWRFHRMHHADRDMDVSTALRFHPIEILASMGLKIALVYAIGPSAIAVLAFEIILNGTALFNHANIRLPALADRVLRLFLVTPDMHRVHHSTLKSEHNSNYGFALSIWDRIFGTYTAQARAGQIVGLKQWQDDTPTKLLPSLLLPWRK